MSWGSPESERRSPETVGVGILGLGFMGRTHLRAWNAAGRDTGSGERVRIAAVCDERIDALELRDESAGNIEADARGELLIDPASVHCLTSPGELLSDPAVDVVSICTPTDTHVELALAAIEAGKHVLLEKPAALTAAGVERIAHAARAASTLCMPAFCMRFWPGWDWLLEQVGATNLGQVRGASFRRLASPPGWSPDFYRDSARTGGALVDLHIHDTDFVRALFGDPASVTSSGSIDHLSTLYRFEGGPEHVVAEGGWDLSPGFPFQMRYEVVFEEATADFDIARENQLLLHRGGETSVISIEGRAGYEAEVVHLLDCIQGQEELSVTIEDALAVAHLLEAEAESLASGLPVIPTRPTRRD